VVNGGREIVSITIDPEFLKSEGLEMAQDAIVGVANAGLKKAGEALDAHMDKVTGGVKVAGLY
jgi:DNA-binding protein YbaB